MALPISHRLYRRQNCRSAHKTVKAVLNTHLLASRRRCEQMIKTRTFAAAGYFNERGPSSFQSTHRQQDVSTPVYTHA